MQGAPGRTTHLANYILERGVWKATCRACGWQASDEVRRQAALLFRSHIRSAAAEQGRSSTIAAGIDSGGVSVDCEP